MKLSANSLKRLVKGACYFEVERGFLTPYRFCEKQLEMARADTFNEIWRNRMVFSGGIRLEMVTDAENISFEFKVYKGDCAFGLGSSVDAWINGALYSVTPIKDFSGRVSISLPIGEKSVSIYLPNYSRFSIKDFTLDGHYRATRSSGKRLLVIGDSITQGYGPSFASGSYFNELQRRTGYDMLNQGIGGLPFSAEQLMYVDGFMPDKIIVFLGTNWYNVSSYDYEKEAADFYNKLVKMYSGKPILAISPVWRDEDGLDRARFDWCREIVKRECEKHAEIKLVDGYSLVPCIADCFCDGIHPTEYGTLMLTNNLLTEMKKIKF